MVHPLTGSDYIEEQAFNAVHSAALASMAASIEAAVADAVTEADIPGEVAGAIALLSLAYVTVSDTEPTTPASGHIWVDTTDEGEVLKVYSGTAWLTVTTNS